MNYKRVLPRDLFNESALLKCLGKLWIHLDNARYPGVSMSEFAAEFAIDQNQSTGGIFSRNVHLIVRGSCVHLERPLNERDTWSLYATDSDDNEYIVFDNDGESLHAEFVSFLTDSE